MTEPDAQYEDRQNFEHRRETILGILGVLDVDQAFIEAIQTVPTLGAAGIPKGRDVDVEVHVDVIADAVISALAGSGLGDLFKRAADRKADVRAVLAKMLRETSAWLADTERLLADVTVQRNDARLERDKAQAHLAELREPGCFDVTSVPDPGGKVHCMEHGFGSGYGMLARCRYQVAADVVSAVLECDLPPADRSTGQRGTCEAFLDSTGAMMTCALDAGHAPVGPDQFRHATAEGSVFYTAEDAAAHG